MVGVGMLLNSPTLISQVQIVKAEPQVAACLALGEVRASSGYGKKFGWRSLAEKLALRQAQQRGATHAIVKEFKPQGAFNGIAALRIFRCAP
ncbi:hypothetical protein JCM13664_05440 [Methylothermus subterraneus]